MKSKVSKPLKIWTSILRAYNIKYCFTCHGSPHTGPLSSPCVVVLSYAHRESLKEQKALKVMTMTCRSNLENSLK